MSGYVANDRGRRPVPQSKPYNGDFDKQPPRPLIVETQKEAPAEKPPRMGCVFAKSCNLPNGVIDYSSPSGFVPVDSLSQYGDWAILGGRDSDSSGTVGLGWIAGAARASTLTSYFGGGSLSLTGALATPGAVAGGSATAGFVTTGVAAGTLMGLVALLIPRATADDDVFYTDEQIRTMSAGRTRVRINVKQLPDGSVSAYGMYTGKNPAWEMVPVIQAKPRGESYVADLGNGLGLIWTPAADPAGTLGIPALESAPQVATVWVHPPSEKADGILGYPELPPEFKDAIIWFPVADVKPIYIVLSVRNDPGVVTGIGETIGDKWLENAGVGRGAPVPSQIAEVLRGKSFSSFDQFRRAFWLAVSQDADLSGRFNGGNKARMAQGLAPRAQFAETIGERRSFELHHETPVAQQGEIYNVDNIRAMTPKHHIDTHRGNK
ncbi:pyocin [Stutzerimonas nosocomialis]|uniref:S-type pyocin domain-containing protein n=1 Tax=Stutzerimonas nosocomialis TaxID=1056496 RepID=UPI001109177F|nr:S-type pyocin domain-containing protein [Stutzerimonas nosocomialis]TLX60612.1 pyocin [Stutzerimonas nosocomialis]